VIVVDTNLLVYLFIRSEHSDEADKAFLKDPDWIAPLLWRSEFLNVLTGCLRKGIFGLDAAIEIAGEAELLMQGGEYSVGSLDVLRLAAGSRSSAYDCEFVVLAREFNIPLVTTNKQILSDFPGTAISLEKFVS